MDEQRLREIEMRAEDARPGRWSELLNSGYFMHVEYHTADEWYCLANHELTLHAVEDIPDLIAALRQAWKERDEANKDAETLVDALEDAHNGHNWKCKAPHYEGAECTCDYEKSLSAHYVRIDKLEGKL